MSTLNNIIEKSSKTERLTKKSIGITPKEISQKKQHFNELQENILLQSKNFSKHNTIKNVKNISNLTTLSSDDGYTLSPVKGPTNPIYPISPTELLEPNIAKLTDIKQKNLFIFYFESLYPLTKSSKKWRKMSVEQLQNYYDNLQFWYIFNNSWSSSPMPVTLSDTVYKKWEKNTFYQANTVVQSAITSWGLAYRNNNGPQDNVKSSLTYTTKSGQQKTINSVTTDKEYWTDVACGNKIEVTSWGWNPYPFGIYAQGPFNGTGNFLDIPKNNVGGSIVGTSHWDIILKCKADNVTNSAVWTSIFNHELHDSGIKGQDPNANQFVYLGNDSNKINVTPWIIIHDMKSGSYNWSWLLGSYNGGYTPILIAYFLWYIGGFGGIGGKSPWDESWQNTGYKYTPIYVIKADGTLAFPEDQSVPANSGLLNFERTSDDFWNGFSKFFALIQSWDTDWNVEKWRHPVLNIDGYPAVGPSVANPSDSLMQAYVTGNFDIVKYSIWNPNAPTEIGSGLGEIDPNLSRFSKNPAKWSSYQTLDGTTYNYADKNGSGFPFGEMIDKGGGYNFVIRTQMPNVNFDICCEFADFRITTPGNLSNGTGDQRLWAELFTKYAEQYMFTADPDDTSISHSFKDKYSIRLPDITLQKSNPQINNWLIANNVASGKTFFDFDVKSGTWDPAPSLTGIQGKKSVSIPKNLGSIPSNNCTVQLYINYGDTCTNSIGNSLEPKAYNNDITNITGTAVTDSKFVTNNNNCGAAAPYPGYTVTNAPAGSQYFPSAVDDFSKGIVGYQANGYTANLGSCQTRWIISSNGIPWDFSAPLSNRLLLLKGSEILDKDKDNDVLKIGLNILLISFIIISTILGLIYILKKNSLNENSKKWLVKCLIISAIITTIIIIFKIINYFQSNRKESLPENVVNSEDHRLRTYFALVYPMVPVSRWNKMSLDELRIFFCSLHWWYKGKGLPSPEDYLGTDYWNNTVPFGKNSSWKTFCLRKNCVKNVAIPAYNETDNKLVVGHNDIVPTSKDDTPSAIIWTGRQLQSLGAQSQQTTFFHPSYNYHIDTYNNFPTVNDTGLEYWQNAQYVEVSSQWGPFPDGIYYDWAPGTGVWLSLEKHVVGYTGLDLIRRMGNEFMDKKLDLSPLYKEAWQKTGLSTMVLDKHNNLTLPTIFWPDYYGGFGLYGSVIFTNNQSKQINNLANSTNPKSTWTGASNYTADGDFFNKIANYVTTQYLVETNGTWTWTNTMPSGSDSYVENYPLPLPYFKDFQNDSHGNPKTNPLALRMPWEYQLFNVCQMMRVFCIDLLFLDESLIDSSKLEGMEYVDWLKANQKSPLNKPRTWKEAIDALNKVIGTPYAHPVLLRYARIFNGTSVVGGDGPSFILENETNPDLNTVQSGALNTDKYIQTVSKNNGATYSSGFGYPQLAAANLEIDHWLPMLGRPMDYKSCVRIQHWCGNKSLSLDIEIINISQQISGNLISNMPTQNLYEVWKKGSEERLSVRDPFANDSHVYFEDGPIHNIRQKYLPSSSNSQSAKWTAPPWIYYYPNQDMSKNISNIYGWPCENLNNFMTSNRLSYCPVNSQQVALSGSYPEYNEILFETFVRNKNILL
jgi:hypothetical protein